MILFSSKLLHLLLYLPKNIATRNPDMNFLSPIPHCTNLTWSLDEINEMSKEAQINTTFAPEIEALRLMFTILLFDFQLILSNGSYLIDLPIALIPFWMDSYSSHSSRLSLPMSAIRKGRSPRFDDDWIITIGLTVIEFLTCAQSLHKQPVQKVSEWRKADFASLVQNRKAKPEMSIHLISERK